MGTMIQQPRAHPDIREGALVLMELEREVVSAIVVDDDTGNPIRLVMVAGGITGVLADELEPTDRGTFEFAIYLRGSRRDDSGDMAAASAAANVRQSAFSPEVWSQGGMSKLPPTTPPRER